ncbi:MAG: SLC13 family permease, partial [Thermoleophilia bacterium]
MTLDAAITLAVIVAVLVLLVLDKVSPAFAVLGGSVFLLVTGVIDASDAFAGFSNSAPLTVAALYVVAAAAARTRVIETLAGGIARAARPGAPPPGERRALARIVAPTAGASAFLNNTPIVAMGIPPILSWARRTGRSPSRYLMPLSFAAVVGGTVTIIGTSTNLVVSGLMEDAGQEPMGFFEIAKVGLPFAVVSAIVLVLVAPRLLPDRRAPSEDTAADEREFTLEMVVEPGAAIVGRSIADAGLRSLQGVYLVEIERDGQRISSVRPDEILAEGDRLTFAGAVDRVVDLQAVRGLRSAEERHFGRVGSAQERRLYEAVIAPSSSLVGSSLKEAGFRGRFGGAVIAIHRADDRVP